MGRKVSGIEDDVLILAGIGVGGYLLYQHFFGGASQTDTNTVTTTLTTPDASNPFSYKYQYGLYAKDPAYYNSAWWLNLTKQYALMDNSGQNPASVSGVYNYVTWGEIIKGAFGLVTVDFNAIQSVIQAVHSQADISNIAAYLFFTYGIELYYLLYNGTGAGFTITSGLSATNFATVINEVSNLPESN